MTDQMRRASRSIGAQIAEAWGKRRYQRHFVSKLTDADAEHLETRHWICTAAACGYVTRQQESEMIGQLAEIERMLHAMIQKADRFCGEPDSTVRDEETDYFSDP